MSPPSVDREALALLDRHSRDVAARVAESYATSATTFGSASRVKFWRDVEALLRGDDDVETMRRRAASVVDVRPRVVARAWRRDLAKRLAVAGVPPSVAGALTSLPARELAVVVEWIERRGP